MVSGTAFEARHCYLVITPSGAAFEARHCYLVITPSGAAFEARHCYLVITPSGAAFEAQTLVSIAIVSMAIVSMAIVSIAAPPSRRACSLRGVLPDATTTVCTTGTTTTGHPGVHPVAHYRTSSSSSSLPYIVGHSSYRQ